MSTNYYWIPGLNFRCGFRLNGGFNRLPTKYESLQQAYLTNEDVFDGREYCTDWPYVQQIHVGKSSGGWAFSLHVLPNLGITDLEDWAELLNYGVLRDEYGACKGPENFIKSIKQRRWHRPPSLPGKWSIEPVQIAVNNLVMPCTGDRYGHVYAADPTKTYFCSLGEYS
jgi:hypothetical protein